MSDMSGSIGFEIGASLWLRAQLRRRLLIFKGTIVKFSSLKNESHSFIVRSLYFIFIYCCLYFAQKYLLRN